MSERETTENRVRIDHLEKNFDRYMEKMDVYNDTVTALLKDMQHSHERHDKSDEEIKIIDGRVSAVEKAIIKWSIPAIILLAAVSSLVGALVKKFVG